MTNRKVQIFGERCSGTNFLHLLIKTNFRDIILTDEYGFKHLFQKEGLRKEIEPDVIYLIIVRNPYDWLRSLYRVPHHAPKHLNLKFSKFLRDPWESYNIEKWMKLDIDKLDNYSEYKVEEFKNVIQLRNYKNKVFLDLLINHKNIKLIKYEDLRDDTSNIMDQISSRFDIRKPAVFKNVYTYKSTDKKFKTNHYQNINKADLSFINENLKWELENNLGYTKDDYNRSLYSHIHHFINVESKIISKRIMEYFKS